MPRKVPDMLSATSDFLSAASFWWVLTMACLVWFSTITVYVAIRGAVDIKHMLARLKKLQDGDDTAIVAPHRTSQARDSRHD